MSQLTFNSENSDLLKNILYRAGAGAGKTTTLTKLIEEGALSYKQTHGVFPHFIVTTFTRKATQELRERLLLRAMEKNDLEFLRFVSSPHHILISTIHGVLSTFLSRHGHSFDFDPSLKIMSSVEERRLQFRVIKELLSSNSEYAVDMAELIEVFSLRRLAEMLHICSRALQQFRELSIFSEQELRTKFSGKVQVLVELAESLAKKLKTETDKEDWIKYSQNLVLVASLVGEFRTQEAAEVLKSLRKPRFTEKSGISAITNEEMQTVRKSIDELLKPAYSPVLWTRHIEVSEKFLRVCRRFLDRCSEMKQQRGSISMADLELRTLEALRRYPGPAKAFSEEWDYWFIDEYQDTSPMQEEILERLQGDKPCFVVGDPQQSIYLFRGARSEVFLRKEKNFLEKGHSVLDLKNNYRSREELVHFFNHYFGSLGREFQSMIPTKQTDSVAEPICFITTQSQTEEFQQISNWIKSLISNGTSPEEICILAKTNEILSGIAKVLRKDGVPHRVHSSGGFAERREVRDALTLLKFLVNPFDSFNLLCLLRSPYFRIQDDQLESFREKGRNFWEILKSQSHSVVRDLKKLRELCDVKGIYNCFCEALFQHGYFEGAHISDESGVRESNLFKLIRGLQEAQKLPGFSYINFISSIDENDQEGSESDAIPAIEPKRVHLMTIHRSKGLQFSHVIVPDFSKGKNRTSWKPVLIDEETQKVALSIPNEEGSSESIFAGKEISDKFFQREMMESHRLLYVAFTRAKLSLCVSMSGEAEKGSWMESCPLDLNFGEHSGSGYKYRVTSEIQVGAESNFKTLNEREDLEILKIGVGKSIRKLSVTSLLRNAPKNENEPSHTHPNVMRAVDKIRAGVELHNIFEALSNSGAENLDSDMQIEKLRAGVPARFQSAVDFVFDGSQIPFTEILKNGEAEYGFVYKLDQFRLEGKIDLWGKVKDELWVIDYKTGSLEYKQKAIEQLTFYALPLMKMLNLTRAKIAVLFPLDEKCFVEEVELNEALEQQLARKLADYSSVDNSQADYSPPPPPPPGNLTTRPNPM